MEPQQDFICFLEVIDTQGMAERKKVYINASWISIGKDAATDFCIDFNDKVSPIHAKIEITKEGIFLHDNRSAHGTFIHGRRITEKTSIGLGTIFNIAEVKLRLSSIDDIQNNSSTKAKPKHIPYNSVVKISSQKTGSAKGLDSQNSYSQKTKKVVKINLGWALFLLLLPLYLVNLYRNDTSSDTNVAVNKSLQDKNITASESSDDVNIIATFAYIQEIRHNSDDNISYFVVVTEDLHNYYAVRLENKQQEALVKKAFLQKSIVRIMGTIERLERGFLIISKQKTKKYILATEVNIEREE